MVEDIITKLTDYGVLGLVTYILLTKVISKLDEIEACLKELKGLLQKHG